MAITYSNNIIQHIFNIYSTCIVVQCRLYTPAKYFVSNSWNSKNMPLLQIATTQFSTTIRELNWNKVIIFACCWPDSWVDRPRDRNYKICKFKNTYTQDNKQLFQIHKYTNTRCNAIEYRSFYLVVLLLAGSSRFWNINDSTRSRLDYILYVSIRALVPKTSIDEHLQKSWLPCVYFLWTQRYRTI